MLILLHASTEQIWIWSSLWINMTDYLGKDGHKLKVLHHAFGYYKNIAHESNIYKSKNNTTLGENAHLCLIPVLIKTLPYLCMIW